MSAGTLRSLVILLILVTLVALAGCGSSRIKVCNATGCCDVCVVPRYLYATGIDGKITIFPVVGSGTLGTPTSISGPASTFGMAQLNNQFLYVSNPQLSVGGTSSIDAWSINLTDGSLSALPGSPFSLGPFSLATGLAINNTAQILYVADAGKIDALKADATGALTTIAGSPFPSGTNLALTVDPGDRFVFASDDDPPGGVFAFTIDSTGALAQAPGSPFAANPSGGAQPRGIVVDSTGSFVYTVLLSTNQIAAFSIIPSSGALNPVPGSPFATGNGPITLATINRFLYVGNLIDRTISGYSIDATTGVLTPLAGSPFAIPGGAMTTDPFGANLYTASANGMLTLSIDPQTGALTQAGAPIPYAGATVLTYVQ